MSESFGTLIGLSNIMTRARSRFPAGPDLDATPGLREQLQTRARRALEGRESYIHDAIVAGRRVRLFSNSHHLADFWRENFPTEGAWRGRTGRSVDPDPVLTVYAAINVEGEAQATYVSLKEREVYLFNTSFYGDLRACALEALGKLLAGDGVRFLHGGAAEVNGRTLLLLYPVEVIHPTPVWGLLERSGPRFVGEGWLAADASGRIEPVEQSVYVRPSVISSYPALAPRFLRARFENVPDPTPSLLDRGRAAAEEVYAAAVQADPRRALVSLPREKGLEVLSRLTGSPDARAMVGPAELFGKARILRGPLEPAAVFALRAEGGELFTGKSVDGFGCPGFEVRVEASSGHPRELARAIAAR